ncbi:similar to Saccharomyces cerevisiae YDL166C FAP7 Essential NTPase required for small ribosome subunit synthesis [Maudiozyma barnettii]|uniref:Adenylate kinase isoenzyme 6 homolog n=1 Tax=Maudiozyma barnettii TaxID=61262 RepID=A0A8H2ZHJ3_9SACH|nr:nucleoside-triphosphatase [Kazachstania barnettii]CAB4252189.1 similar to Saccharomyces cerevisiae YDL166C FAP7 Essential NTPase required for small ribosome subunit synthesis [Kazachstania barnettii]CAD1778797.1 similar to Saccharomyces cerevisiae YDL166C FAP7 Essential NTPase required for small ribosome subunit synthesis [Kazachstania barnettii]
MGELRRHKPNLLITGTPGCGKSTTCELLQRNLPGYKYYDISSFAKEHNCYDGYDEGRKSHIVDEDKLLDELEPLLAGGGSIVDWHVNDVFPERLIDLVVVLRCDNSTLYDRLNKRGYHDSKIQENLDAEIMGVLLQDAMESYEQEIVVELQSNNTKEMEANVDRITAWENMWLEEHKDGVSSEPPKQGHKTTTDDSEEEVEEEEKNEEEKDESSVSSSGDEENE